MIILFFLLAFSLSQVCGVDPNLYRTCAETFCNDLRDLKLENGLLYSADVTSAIIIDNSVVIPLISEEGEPLNLQIFFLEENTVRVKVLENDHSRYELVDVLDKEPTNIPIVIANSTNEVLVLLPENQSENSYEVVVNSGPPFTVKFYKEGQLEVILNGEQLYVENTDESQVFSFKVEFEDSTRLYGLFDHATKLTLTETVGTSLDPYRVRNTDTIFYEVGSTMAMYGSVPVIYGYSEEKTSGVFFHNAAQEWVDVSYKGDRPSAHFMVESGTFDLFIMLGPSLKDVVRQYTSLTGTAHLPQLWALGYHQCRNAYNTQELVKEVVALMDAHNFPMDVIWLDSDWSKHNRYFIWNPETFSDPIEMQQNISASHRKIVAISDPFVNIDEEYILYQESKDKYFIKNPDGTDYIGTCWPGDASWLDFLNPEVRDYYGKWYAYDKFNSTTETIAGIWNDMNEPASFEIDLERSIPFTTVHHGNVPHRDVHNIYGLLHVKSTHNGLMERDKGTKRPFILARSHFAGSQRYTAMWTGDNTAEFPYLALSYSQCLNANLLGQVLCGADVSGFFGNPSEELYQRWYQAAAWLPFFRAHSENNTARREPYLFSEEVQDVVRNAIRLRYKHLPVWYTLFFQHTQFGDPLIRPLFYEFPGFPDNDDHLLLGSDILVRPIFEEAATKVTVNFPGAESEYWYRADDGSWTIHTGGSSATLDVDITTIPIFYRSGSIIIRKDIERRSSTDMLDDPYTLYVNLNEDNEAEGLLYIDDYTSFDYLNENAYLYIQFKYVPETGAIRIHEIHSSGDSASFDFAILSIVIHQNTEKGTKTTVHTATADGIPLKTLSLPRNLNGDNGEYILKL